MQGAGACMSALHVALERDADPGQEDEPKLTLCWAQPAALPFSPLHVALEREADPGQEDEPEQEQRLVQEVQPLALVLQVVELQDLARR